VLLTSELNLRYHINLHSRFKEDGTKTAVAIKDDRYFGQTDTQTDIQSSDFMYV